MVKAPRRATSRHRTSDRPARPKGRPSWYPATSSLTSTSTLIRPYRTLTDYTDLREAFPLIDAATHTWFSLLGEPEVKGSPALEEDLNTWMSEVRVNQEQRGLLQWLRNQVDQMLTYGLAVGEIVPNRQRDDVWGLTTLNSPLIELHTSKDPLELSVQLLIAGGTSFQPNRVELKRPWYLLSLHNQHGDDPYGRSMWWSCPNPAEALTTIQNATAQLWEREGAPRYHVNWIPHDTFSDPDGSVSEGIVNDLAEAFQSVMTAAKSGEIEDYFSSGQVTVTPIGSGEKVPDMQAPARFFMEQLVSCSGLPPWLLGLHWSSTERLSTQQQKILVSRVEGLRRELMPALRDLLELRQRLRGNTEKFEIEWSHVDLSDLVETARGRWMEARAESQEIENGVRQWELGYTDQEGALKMLDPDSSGPVTHRVLPPNMSRPPELGGSDDEEMMSLDQLMSG